MRKTPLDYKALQELGIHYRRSITDTDNGKGR